MCTVTFLPLQKESFILTSNRDETPLRETIPPKKYDENGIEMLYPKDTLAGGTWIGVSEKKRLVCVLNGGFIKHKRKVNYAKSRGVLAKEILSSDCFEKCISNFDLEGVEPFTMVIVDWNKELQLFELIWDEKEQHFVKLPQQPKIWSSSTLYSHKVKEIRKSWFKEWSQKNEFSSESILDFHHLERGAKEQTIFMKRPKVETVSITSVKKENDQVEMKYEDVVNSTITHIQF
jgi:hypothetical protein